MPIGDYDTTKSIDVFSVGGTPTVSKAQPVLLIGNDFTGVDDFESGSSQLGWETDGWTVDTNGEIYADNSLTQAFTSSATHIRDLDTAVTDDDSVIQASYKITNTSGSGWNTSFICSTSGGTTLVSIDFTDANNIQAFDGSTGNIVDTWTAGEIYDLEVILDFTNNQYDLRINGSLVAQNFSFFANNTGGDVSKINLSQGFSGSGGYTLFLDRLTYTSDVQQSIGGGSIGIDFTGVADAEDIAFYDENDNLLDYEIESLDTTEETAVAWVYNDWVRDGSTQLKVAYGNNSANTDRQNVTGTWNNSGQDYQAVWHLDETSGSTIDSTVNNNDSAGTTGTYDVSGQFNGARSLDGSDDQIDFTNAIIGDNGTSGQFFIKAYGKASSPAGSGDTDPPIYNEWNRDSAFDFIALSYSDNSNNALLRYRDSVNQNFTEFPGTVNVQDGEWHQIIGLWDVTNGEVRVYVDGQLDASQSDSDVTAGYDFATEGATVEIGRYTDGGNYLQADLDEINVGTFDIGTDWVKADYDASPAANQVFFSQQAASQATEQTLTTDINTVFSQEQTNNAVLDVLFEDQFGNTFAADTQIQRADEPATYSFDTVITQRQTQTTVLDAVLQALNTETTSLDTQLKGLDVAKTLDLDTQIQTLDQSETAIFDFQITVRGTQTSVFDTVFQGTNSEPVGFDTLFEDKENPQSWTFDTQIQEEDQTQLLSADTIITLRGTDAFTLDTVLQAQRQETFNLDTQITTRGTNTLDLDTGFSKDDVIKTFQLDTRMVKQPRKNLELETVFINEDTAALQSRAKEDFQYILGQFGEQHTLYKDAENSEKDTYGTQTRTNTKEYRFVAAPKTTDENTRRTLPDGLNDTGEITIYHCPLVSDEEVTVDVDDIIRDPRRNYDYIVTKTDMYNVGTTDVYQRTTVRRI